MMLEMVQVHIATGVTRVVCNGCCTAMWKANGKTTTLPLFLESLFQKQRHHVGEPEDEEEDVRRCWMTLGTEEDIFICRRKLWIALSGETVLEETVDLSSDRLLMNE
ncbi:hypothetical protein B7P43_G14498 [Cryptotermes secundus]|uniref:Uncharacterized protein n=1 Tax=Cryptotermes secundus TaxID=105785 RepID=A0A2J7PPP1_9NEOP|nr:hypothetical protein B7P43_G14498 [Cryptotermes secundus]